MTEGAELWLLTNREALVVDWGRCTDQIKKVTDQIKELAAILIETVASALKDFLEQFCVFYVGLQRIQLEIVLMRRWHLPNNVAYWLSQWCPQRWLSELKPELWDEGETA